MGRHTQISAQINECELAYSTCVSSAALCWFTDALIFDALKLKKGFNLYFNWNKLITLDLKPSRGI